MSRKLTNKQLLVLDVLRRNPQGITAHSVADAIRDEAPMVECKRCEGTGVGRAERDCPFCSGRGERRAHFSYGTAYQALQGLRKKGLAGRRCKRDEWGDEIPTHVYYLLAQPDSDDPLERLYQAPAARSGTEAGEQ